MEYLNYLNKIYRVKNLVMKIHKQKIIKDIEKIYNRKIECSINKASNEIMLHRISGGKDIEFPFCSLNKQ